MRTAQCGLAVLMACCCLPSVAQPAQKLTVEVGSSRGRVTAGLGQVEANSVRGVWAFASGDVLNAEVLDERKFGLHGQVVALGGTKVLSPEWSVGGTLVSGQGGDAWARNRYDLELTKAWGPGHSLLTRAARYHARFDGNRADKGWRLSSTVYLSVPLVLEGGVTLNVSEPGAVRSHMPYLAATFGKDGEQYLVLRATRGTEAYQAVAAGAQLVDFKSNSLGLRWQYWLAPSYGLVVQGEHYRNPSYERKTVGMSGFAQW